MFREDVACASGDLTADRHSAVPILHLAIADHDVLDGNCHSPAIGIAARLERDAVVTGVEGAFLDEHVGAALRIASVSVRTVSIDQLAHGYIRAQHWIHLPHGRTQQRDALDQNVLAPVRLDEVRTQPVPRPKNPLR